MKFMIRVAIAGVVAALAAPIPAAAQTGGSGIAGVVRDTNAGVLPGVTVEASSPALIEKTRATVTGADGSYRMLDLRPGVYSVTYSLAGFRTVRREGVELPAAFTATVNVDLEIGTIAETITVSGAAPLVDVQNVTSNQVLSREVLDAIPVTSRSPQGFAALMPGVIGQGIAGTPGGREEMNTASHGAQARDSLYLIDGASVGGVRGEGGAAAFFRISQAYAGEITVTLGGGTAELAYSGTVTNVIPKEGGNRLTGTVYLDFAGSNFSASNLTPELEAQGFTKDSLSNLRKLWDVSPAVGGPILTDKLWFFTSYRNSGSVQTRAGLFENATPLGWVYTPDRSKPAVIRLVDKSYNLRLTWQASQSNKFSAFVDNQPHIVYQRGYQNQISPEATAYAPFPNFFYQLNWKSTINSRMLLDSSLTYNSTDIPQFRHTPETCDCDAPAVGTDVISALDSSIGMMFRANSGLLNVEPYGNSNSRAIRYISSRVVRHRAARGEARVPADARPGVVHAGNQRRAWLHALRRRTAVDYAVGDADSMAEQRERGSRSLHPGSMDDEAPDRDWWFALRLLGWWCRGDVARRRRVRRRAPLRGYRALPKLERPVAADRHRLRRVRRFEDSIKSERRPVHHDDVELWRVRQPVRS